MNLEGFSGQVARPASSAFDADHVTLYAVCVSNDFGSLAVWAGV